MTLPYESATSAMTQPKIMPVEECGAIGKCMAHPSSYLSRIQYGEKTTARAAALALQDLEAARARDIATHERNLPAMENNRLIAAQITALNVSVGMPARWSERDRTSRSRYPKTIGHDAGYITDIRRECKTDDGFDAATVQYERTLKSYREYEEQGKREAEAAARAKEREQAAALEKRKADIELAAILLRYCLPIESTWSDVLQALREALAADHLRDVAEKVGPAAPVPLTDTETHAELWKLAVRKGLITVRSELIDPRNHGTRVSWMQGHDKACDISNDAAAHGIAASPAAPAAPVVRDLQQGVLDQECNYMAPMGRVCNKCGRIHRGITGASK